MLLAGGDGLKGPFGTALLGHVLHAVAYRGTILVLGFYIALFLRYTSPVLLSMELLVFLLGHLFALYMEVVCTLAVVVSAAEPAGCFLRCARAPAGMVDHGREDHTGCDPRVRQGRGEGRCEGDIHQGRLRV